MLIINDFSELISFFEKELGIKQGDEVNTMTPQFQRNYELEIKFIPQNIDEFNVIIKTATKDIFKKMGVCVWEEDHTGIIYLFPGEWYDFIPEGFEIVDILGCKDTFKKGVSDDDIRFGCLPYGFKRSF